MLVLKLEVNLSSENPAPKEYVFVVDCSGSMSGQPMTVAKESIRHFIRNMSTDDSFQIIKLSNQASSFSEAPIEATYGETEIIRMSTPANAEHMYAWIISGGVLPDLF